MVVIIEFVFNPDPTLKAIHADPAQIEQVFMNLCFVSGYQANQISHNFVLDEGLNFLSKPFDLDDLAAKVREVLT